MTPTFVGRFFLCLALVALAGCTGIARPGPAELAITSKSADLAGFTLINMEAENVADYRVQSVRDTAGTAGIPSIPKVSLSPGDVLKVRISETKDGGIFAPLASGGGTAFDNVRVDYKGTISIPYVGRVKVSGLDPQQVEDRISIHGFMGKTRGLVNEREFNATG